MSVRTTAIVYSILNNWAFVRFLSSASSRPESALNQSKYNVNMGNSRNKPEQRVTYYDGSFYVGGVEAGKEHG